MLISDHLLILDLSPSYYENNNAKRYCLSDCMVIFYRNIYMYYNSANIHLMILKVYHTKVKDEEVSLCSVTSIW